MPAALNGPPAHAVVSAAALRRILQDLPPTDARWKAAYDRLAQAGELMWDGKGGFRSDIRFPGEGIAEQ